MDPYDYPEHGGTAGLGQLCKRLSSGKAAKDTLIKGLKQLASILESTSQEPGALGPAREDVPRAILALLHHSDKDVKLYLAACIVHMLRIWAPQTPYDDEPDSLEAVLGGVLWVVNRLQNHAAPTFQLAASVLQTFCETKSYYLLTDDREEAELEWFRALLDCVTEANAEAVELYAGEILCGMLEDDSLVTDAKVEALLSCLVPPAADDSPAAAQLARAVLRRRERQVQPTLQRLLTRLLTSPITASSGLWEQSYAVVAQLHDVTPQALLPVVPHLSDELCSPDAARRLEAARLLGRLFGRAGGAAVAAEWGDVLLELLRRFKDEKPEIRMEMVQLAGQLVAGLTSEETRAKVLEGAFERLRDPDEKVRTAACKACCALAAAHPGLVADNVAAAGGRPYHLEEISVRMRDLKPAVRRAAAAGLLAIFRGRVAKGGLAAAEGVLWIPARAMKCACADAPLRHELETAFWRDGLLGPAAPPALAAAAWAGVWRGAPRHEVGSVAVVMEAKAHLQCDMLAFLELRRRLAGTEGDERTGLQTRLDAAARKVAKHLPDPQKAEQQLAVLRDVRDNRVAASLLAALALGAKSEVRARAAAALRWRGRARRTRCRA
ncbi:MAG: armadillo-type protein [Monoraphidium minutum]|nr:MAG: armadillo-type protein [Monoraphidium minutum]